MIETPIGVILGSSFSKEFATELGLVAAPVATAHGPVLLYRSAHARPAYCLFRHGLPHHLLPNHIAWRANASALRNVGVGALLVTSSVGVLDASIPLFEPLVVSDLLMLENRLSDGSLCTMFETPSADHAHLVLDEGLLSDALTDQIRDLARVAGHPISADVVFGYAPGPRTKTRAENAAWAKLGAQVNSMTLGPEIVLANELGIPCAGLVVGHKHSLPSGSPAAGEALAASLVRARVGLEAIVLRFIESGTTVPSRNSLFRFGANR